MEALNDDQRSLADMPFLPGSLDSAVAPGTPPIMVCGNSFPLVRGVHSNVLRSRERRFESCRGHCRGH